MHRQIECICHLLTGLSPYPREAVMAPEVSLPNGPLCALLGQNGLLAFPLGQKNSTERLGTAHGAYSFEEQPYRH